MPGEGQMRKKNGIPARRKKADSKEEASFDLGFEEGAELQDRKLGREIWLLRTEYIAKVKNSIEAT